MHSSTHLPKLGRANLHERLLDLQIIVVRDLAIRSWPCIAALLTMSPVAHAIVPCTSAAPSHAQLQGLETAKAQARLYELGWTLSNPGSAEAREADCLLETLKQARLDRPSDWKARFALAMRQWDFRAAARLKQSEVGTELFEDHEIPTAAMPSGSPVQSAPIWRMDLITGVLREQQMRQSSGPILGFFFDPECGPCRRAAADFQRSERLHTLMAACGIWLAQIDYGTKLGALRRWAQQHGAATVWAIRDWGRFGIPTPRGTPTFLLIRNGRVHDQVVGWPPEGEEAAILAMVRLHDPEGTCS